MMVPRSYQHHFPEKPSSLDHHSEKSLYAMARSWSSAPKRRKPANPALPTREVTEPVSVPTRPVVIPPRSQSGAPTATQTVRIRGQHGGTRQRKPDESHRPNAVPPAVAALLAVTSIPRPKSNPSTHRRSNFSPRRISIDELIQEWRQDDTRVDSVGYSSPLAILLERLDEPETDDSSEKETPRSVSSESTPSLPSLDADDHSLPSWSNPSSPATPQHHRRSTLDRKDRHLSSPPIETCSTNHPLLTPTPTTLPDDNPLDTLLPDLLTQPPPPPKPRSTLKSNLTASLHALASAAKSFSNFTAPTIPADDLLTRPSSPLLLLSPHFTSEMRPKPLPGGAVPEPALRRYLNPPTHGLSATELSMQLHGATRLDDDKGDSGRGCGDKDGAKGKGKGTPPPPMIPLQPYTRRRKAKRTPPPSSSPSPPCPSPPAADPLSEAGRALNNNNNNNNNPAVRQREPRENGDFLRVVVLEMEMRRRGKLDPRAGGRARIWLPPRRGGGEGGGEGVVEGEREGRNSKRRVPRRWVGVSCGEVI